jgi:hypothetical protein
MAWATSMAFGHRPICDKCSEMDALSLLALLGFVVACFVAGFGGAVFRPGEWYEHLAEPSWRPPNRLFVPVWTVLYLIIAVSGWLVWPEVGFAITVLPVRQSGNAPAHHGRIGKQGRAYARAMLVEAPGLLPLAAGWPARSSTLESSVFGQEGGTWAQHHTRPMRSQIVASSPG